MRWRCVVGVAVAMTALFPFVGGEGAGLNGQAVHQCSYCHDVHGGFTSADVALNREAVVEDMCMTCHGAAGIGYLLGPDLVNDTVNSSIDFISGVHNGSLHQSLPKPPNSCWDCHGHEGDAQGNLFLIPRNFSVGDSVVKTVVFTDNTTQADFTGTDGLCYVCHEQPSTMNNGLNGHYAGVCTTCHAHEGGFQPTGGGGCTSCHNAAKGNHREVVSEFDRASHHVQLGGAGADIPPEDCTTCHDQDSAGGHYREGSDLVYLIDPDDASIIAYDRGVTDPSVLTNFCIGCHDANGATRLGGQATTPFSDGNIRPIIDETAWLASSHEGSGNADCADCHESHGSGLNTLFMPGDTFPDPTTNVENEEGFCFQCHSSTGVASVDVQSQFNDATINWTSDAWGVSSITTFNDRHDVTHAASSVSGAKIECVNCHRPHADNSSQKYNPDPDPSSAAVTWAGQTPMDAFCVDCHDGGLPTGVLDHTGGPMGDIATYFTTVEKHGPTPSDNEGLNTVVWMENTLGAGGANMSEVPNPYLNQTGPDSNNYTHECVQCHRPHPKAASEWATGHTVKYDFFSLQDTVRAPNGLGMAYWEDISDMGTTTRTIFWDYGLSEDNSSRGGGLTEANAGGYYCNTCHDRRGMNGKNTCGSSGCHRHGASTGM